MSNIPSTELSSAKLAILSYFFPIVHERNVSQMSTKYVSWLINLTVAMFFVVTCLTFRLTYHKKAKPTFLYFSA